MVNGLAASILRYTLGSARKKGLNRSEWLERSQRAVAIPFERTTMWRLRFVIVPYYSLRFGFRPVRTKSLAGQSPLMVFDRSPQKLRVYWRSNNSLRAKIRFSWPRVARIA